ncbi:unnamed protein product [Candida verbasci]|uniref:6-O-methylguanine-DNA methyltransferase n=1 Tax=Candida verbasci TaxID=1227364 RepID=A0A9W4TV83_9ASCO|nr:unnamed protein product [Candida verbasci]
MTTRQQELDLKIVNAPNKTQYRVLSAVTKVPKGKVTTYGHIAELIGKPRSYSRVVGQNLKHCKLIIKQLNETLDDESKKIDQNSFPWWRILSQGGSLAKRGNSGEAKQKTKLEEEGLEFVGSGNKKHIDMKEYGWFPSKVEYKDVKDEEVDFDKEE